MKAGKSGRRSEGEARPQASPHPVASENGQTEPKSRLVFGLSSRTNKTKHDEYAEKRCSQLESNISREGQRHDEGASLNEPEKERQLQGGENSGKSGKVRASRYGNFYKPQDLSVQVSPMKSDNRTASMSKGTKARSSPVSKRDATAAAAANRAKTATDENADSSEKSSSQLKVKEAPQEQSKHGARNARMQFHVPPPPQQVSIPNTGKGSVVSYAKSRIYDKSAKYLGPAAGANIGQSLLESGVVPEAILSGFKPPKQVNVSKAREQWEGGEPFAKCKSRQRLAAQAGKKLSPGGWSMSSVVATQQLQLQQALANFSSPSRPTLDRNDQPVKVLTRGSVLERVQQFEKAPVRPDSASGPVAIASELAGTGSSKEAEEASLTISSAAERSDAVIVNKRVPEGSNKLAYYKSRVTSLQIDSATSNDPLAGIISSPTSPKSPTALFGSSRFNDALRRRTSASNSSLSTIPKFYHPNGKPNTYEMELQKRNIVACFDKFPDRKALLSGPMARRHFHQIALACAFSEYFKEPLCLYVKHQLTQSNLLHAPTRKQSGIGVAPIMSVNMASNELKTKVPVLTNSDPGRPKTLARAASIDTSTMEKIQSQNFVTCEQFLTCWRNIISSCFDNASRFIHLLTLGKRSYLIQDDFIPLIQSIIDDHPGLKFLRGAPDFHLRYIQTVIARIYFCVNTSWTGKINSAELRRSNLLAVLEVLSQEEDINQITDYFSYEHFYVIYCKFWTLDQDHDLFISKEDLARHNDAAISSRIIERIFMGIVSRQVQKSAKMSYSDFVWFLIAEEDKKHPRSIEYWFRLMDIDGDGYISMYEMEYFYFEQKKRLEMMNIEALPFNDCACQILDLVNPKVANKVSLADLKRTKLAPIFFDTFINLEKYLEHESREFVSTRDTVQDGVVISDWDRYAQEEYESLVIEESSL